MPIKLFEHNQAAYESAVSMLKSDGKAAVIHPTGTGKSFIGFKLCEDNPDKRICWLSPSKYIFSTQLENLKQDIGSSDEEPLGNITFLTYAKLLNMDEEELGEIAPDYIVLDEFHRCGALEWGRGVDHFLEMYSDVPILGLSATSVRYLDNQRDMADEIFEGHIASEITLGEAIVRGILNPPKYVLGVFSYSEELNRYEDKVRQTKNMAQRDKAEEYLEKLRRALDKAEGLDVIFDKHITDRTGKYIVFCANFEAMEEAKAKVGEWFHFIDKAPHVYTVYSDDPTASKSFAGFKNDDDTEHLRLLYCIDALNEGVHIEGVSGVILLRPTVSPTIYKQQIGRALSASKKTDPVIFDIVNNIKNLYSIDAVRDEMNTAISYLRGGDSEGQIVNDTFEVIDELSNCLDLFNLLEDSLTASWDVMYLEAKQYFEANGNLLVPADYVTERGYSLGRWIRTQRISSLSDDKVQKLEQIGMVWGSVIKEKWMAGYAVAKQYYETFGNLNVNQSFVFESDSIKGTFPNGKMKLGAWISSQRTSRSKGKLSQDQIDLLDKIGMCWADFDDRWESGYDVAVRYSKERGNINFVPTDYNDDSLNLSKWLHTQRNRYKTGKLSDDRIKRMEDIGFVWSGHEAFWNEGYTHACEYKNEHGNLKVPQGFVCSDGFKLRSWINNQCTRIKKGSLSEQQVNKLKEIGVC
ncbi:Superfamily II DNA or RNA helicase [Lachnospiraceae bacterium NE2001]|nr:Superfamily II DNA or RNA helicase [Lachnospiraceae bacterium NE2001]